MATIIAHIRVKPGREAAFEQTARTMFAASHGNEKALRRYEYWRSQEPGKYYCLLAFDDYVGFMIHQSSPHHEAAAAPLMDLIAELRLEWIDPVQGASPLPATHARPLPPDAGPVMRRYAEMMPVATADWWDPLREA
ncbi:putative quinol monooxygenase [Phenylobacterium montanum]|uniref:Antibiotic biosynthesis monooxygenase n=1 Tax=Phenylobacterium montanum TaxID=2823693 RepID=A0A975G4G7_9CAUL|nr:antibiotic biosynthesis monooxygenase family protein [Caulobacter sp. S6]QUD90412.1 antibiotic biosynthesis monooxygenase [Caulobacter sp. S6]